MLADTIRYWVQQAGITAAVGLGVRMTYQLGRLIEAFRHHVKESDSTFSSHNERITFLERRRK